MPDPVGYSTRKSVAEVLVVALERADHEVVEREPDRAPPVGVAPEHGGGRLGRLVVDGGRDALDVDAVRVVAVVGGQGPQPVGRQELVLVEQRGQQAAEVVLAHHRQQEALAAGRRGSNRSALQADQVAQPGLPSGSMSRAKALPTVWARATTPSSITAAASSGMIPTMERTLTGTAVPSGVVSVSQ